MKHFLHIGFHWVSPPDVKKLEATFNAALDWVRYAPNCWIVWTSSDPNKWAERLKPFLMGKDRVFICKLDITVHQGYLQKWIWDWINKSRT